MKHLLERLITFRGWEDRPFVRNLAALGFYREFNSDYADAVKCYFCRVVLYNWEGNEDIYAVHLR